MMANKRQKETAQQVFEQRRQNVSQLLSSIQNLVTEEAREEIHWGHAGSMGFIETSLQEIYDFLTNED
jgi:hypothetical protein